MLDCPLKDSEIVNSPLIPWAGMRYSCVKVLNLYCKVFSQQELFDLIVRKTCQACKCPRENHEIYHEQLQNVKDRLGIKIDSKTSQIDPKKLGYTWTPPGILTSSKIQRYFELLPAEKVPKIGTNGEKYRDRQLVMQLPRQDLTLNYCKHIENDNRASYEDFIAARNEIALDVGFIRDASETGKCHQCNESINQAEMCVNAPKLSDEFNFHPRCFKCSTCDELLVDLTYCVLDEKLFCERHYAEMLKPRCNSCDENFAVRSTTPEPDVSIEALDAEVSNISSSSPLALRRTKRFVESLDRSASRSSSRLSRGRKTPASEEDYKEWFDKFDNHISPNLTVREQDDDFEFESEIDEGFLIDENLSGAEICKIEDEIDESRDVSVSVTLNLNKKSSPVAVTTSATCHPCAEFQKNRTFKTKAEEMEELHRFRNQPTRRISIVPSTEEQQQNYVSMLHPEEFSQQTQTTQKKNHEHHVHLHNVGYSEWMKKIVDHHSSHLTLSDTDSDSDVPIDDVKMLPLFCDEKRRRKVVGKTRHKKT